MDKELIIRMAREAGGLPDPMVFIGAYERFAALVYAKGYQHGLDDFEATVLPVAIAAEREACAKVCEDLDAWNLDDPGSTAAAAIRARGQSK